VKPEREKPIQWSILNCRKLGYGYSTDTYKATHKKENPGIAHLKHRKIK
jgi:hypothetical protein